MARPLLAVALCLSVACEADESSSPTAEGSTSQATGSTGPGTGTSSAGADTTTSGETPPTDPCAPGDNPSIEVGHGEGAFEPFDVHSAELVYGMQGGYHIVVGVRGVHTDNTGLSELRIAGFIDGEERAFGAPFVELRCVDERQEVLDLLLIWDSTPAALHGKTALVRAELTDTAGDVFVAEGEVVIDDPTME